MNKAVLVPLIIGLAVTPALAEPPERIENLDHPAYSEPAKKWEGIDEAATVMGQQVRCEDKFQHTETQSIAEPKLIREASTPRDAQFVYGVDLSEEGCKKMLVKDVYPPIQPLPKVEDDRPRQIPASDDH